MGGYSDKKQKAALIEGMVRNNQWRMNYRLIENTVSKLPNREKKQALQIIDNLVSEGWAEYHKNGECVSLNSSKRREIREFLEEYSEMEIWMLDTLF